MKFAGRRNADDGGGAFADVWLSQTEPTHVIIEMIVGLTQRSYKHPASLFRRLIITGIARHGRLWTIAQMGEIPLIKSRLQDSSMVVKPLARAALLLRVAKTRTAFV